MARTSRAGPHTQIKIVLDSNAVYTGDAHFLLSNGASTAITENAERDGVRIAWCLPSVVIAERRYQMLAAGAKLLGPVAKLERLLGHNLNITETILEHRVDITIAEQIEALGISELKLDHSQVKWESICDASVKRLPPFSGGDVEKGFRDAQLLESFAQLIAQSPATPSACRLVLVTGDVRLIEAATARFGSASNVQIVPSLTDVQDLINTVAADVTDSFITPLKAKAGKLYFVQNDDTTLHRKVGVRRQINETFAKELLALPVEADLRENDDTWGISAPSFVRKDRQRIFWATRITVKTSAYKKVAKPPNEGLSKFLSSTALENIFGGLPPSTGVVQASTPKLPLQLPKPSGSEDTSDRILVSSGTTVFEVEWSMSVSTTGNISKLRVDDIKFVDTVWNAPQ